MTGGTISATAEWARRGKTPEDTAYRVLGCSDGKLSRRNFEEAIDRFLPGTLDELPQVSVSYLARGDQPGGSYLALAIHEFAEGQVDAVGREIAFLRYFCVPYEQLAGDAITYRAMYKAFHPIQLPMGGGPPQPVTLEVTRPRVPADDYLARQVAALLLEGPVCVLGADRILLEERLRFIDTVMSLLPYGMRSRMSASTWTSSTYETHRFRLFFSSAPRATEGKDHAVVWGRPERTQISPDLIYAYEYLVWLDDKVQQPVRRLAELTDEFGFGRKQVNQMLERIGIGGEHLDYSADRQDLLHPTYTPPQSSKSYGENLLLACVQHMEDQNLPGLKSDIAALRNHANVTFHKEDRERYQDVIRSRRLLRAGLPLGKLEGRYYDALLRLAFGMPLSYPGYCQLESCLDISTSDVPHRSLLEAVEHGGMADARVSVIVLRCLGKEKLGDWFRSKRVDAGKLIGLLAGEWERPRHAQIAGDATALYLLQMKGRYDPRSVLAALMKNGRLAQAMHLRHPDSPQYQVNVLSHILDAATGGNGLDRYVIYDVMIGTGAPPTPALLAAVLLTLADRADAPLAKELYLNGLLRFTDFDPKTRAFLDRYAPHGIVLPDRRAVEQAPRQERPQRDVPASQDEQGSYPVPPASGMDLVRELIEAPEASQHHRFPMSSRLVRKVVRPKPGEGQ